MGCGVRVATKWKEVLRVVMPLSWGGEVLWARLVIRLGGFLRRGGLLKNPSFCTLTSTCHCSRPQNTRFSMRAFVICLPFCSQFVCCVAVRETFTFPLFSLIFRLLKTFLSYQQCWFFDAVFGKFSGGLADFWHFCLTLLKLHNSLQNKEIK